MTKDYFQDITPPAGDRNPPRQFTSRPPNAAGPMDDAGDQHTDTSTATDQPVDPVTRGIRSISAPPRSRPLHVAGIPNRMDGDIRGAPPISGGTPPRPPRSFSRLWIWAAASVLVLSLAAGLLFFFGSTSVTVTPKSRTASLTSIPLTARQATSTGETTQESLSYTVQTFDLEDSEVIEARGTIQAESKASGSITVYNAYSISPVDLVKNTRFESPDGLIFRVLSDIVIPGKRGSTPGTVSVTVVADQPGEKYNIGPVQKFTLPGLKSTAALYTGVYAKSAAAITGGASGDQPGTAPGALEAAVALSRGRLETKAHEAALGQAKDDTFVFPELISITYESLPNTTETGSSVRIHQKARVEIPVFPAEAFAQAIAQAAFTDFDNAPITVRPLGDFSVHALAPGDKIQTGILNVVVSGSALVIWKIDVEALATALQGKDNSEFQSIVNGFSSIQEARARIAPFWKSTFPGKAADIKIHVVEPTATK